MKKFKDKNIKQSKINTYKNSYLIWGKHSIESAINNLNRNINIIYSTKNNLYWLNEKLENIDRNKVQIKETEKQFLDKLSGNSPHQGIIAEVSSLEWPSLHELLSKIEDRNSRIVLLDQVTDPQNIGSIIRLAQAFNVDAIIATKIHVPNENGLMARASAGAIENIPLIRVTNLSRAIETIKNEDFEIIGLESSGTDNLEDIAKFSRIALVLGSEGRGLRHLTKEKLSYLVKIPIAEKTESLNVSTAAAIALYVIRN